MNTTRTAELSEKKAIIRIDIKRLISLSFALLLILTRGRIRGVDIPVDSCKISELSRFANSPISQPIDLAADIKGTPVIRCRFNEKREGQRQLEPTRQ